jgi:phosphate transport system permease protein
MTLASRRRLTSNLFVGACALSVAVALIPLASILWWVGKQGILAMNWDFFTKMPKPVGEAGGGMANAIVGSGILLAMAGAMAVPVGVLCGVHLAEYRGGRLAWTARFASDVLNGVPSIVVGIFAYTLVVEPVKRFSAFAGSVALAVLMIPLVARTTEEMLRLVPKTLGDGARALGATRTRAVLRVVLPAAIPGIATGVLVSFARIAGETAPLLFTALNNQYWSVKPYAPIGSLPVQIYTYANSPYEDWHRQAWCGALVLVTAVLVLSVASRAVVRRLARMHRV